MVAFLGFTDRLNVVWRLAWQIAERFNQKEIGLEHVLLALIEEGESVGVAVLRDEYHIDLGLFKEELERRMEMGVCWEVQDNRELTDELALVIHSVDEKARKWGRSSIHTWHILLSLWGMDGLAHDVLTHFRVDKYGIFAERIKDRLEAVPL